MATVKGEQPFEIDGDRYVLVFGVNAMIAVEDELDMGINDLGALLNNLGGKPPRIKLLRTLFHAALLDHQPDIIAADAGRLMTTLGIQRAAELVMETFAAALPKQEAGDEAAADPPKKRAGTGSRS